MQKQVNDFEVKQKININIVHLQSFGPWFDWLKQTNVTELECCVPLLVPFTSVSLTYVLQLVKLVQSARLRPLQ